VQVRVAGRAIQTAANLLLQVRALHRLGDEIATVQAGVVTALLLAAAGLRSLATALFLLVLLCVGVINAVGSGERSDSGDGCGLKGIASRRDRDKCPCNTIERGAVHGINLSVSDWLMVQGQIERPVSPGALVGW